MAHNIFSQNGIYSAAFNVSKNGLPWHKLGQMVNGAMTWSEAMEKAHLNWEVKTIPLFIRNPFYNPAVQGSNKGYTVPGHYATIRTDIEGEKSILGVVGSKYKPVQNKYMFDFVDSMLESIDGAHYESAGVLGNGERVWCLAAVPSMDYSIGNDKHQIYLLFEGSHDGTKSCTVKMTDVRVVCQNTLNLALSDKNFEEIKVRHTAGATSKLESIKKTWSGIKSNVDSLKFKFSKMLEKKVSNDNFNNAMKKLLGSDWQESTRKQNVGLEIARIFKNNDHSAYPEQAGTAYNLLNSITNYVDHNRSARTDGGKIPEQTARAEAAAFGTGAMMKENALEIIYNLCDTSIPEPVTNKNTSGSIDKILSMIA